MDKKHKDCITHACHMEDDWVQTKEKVDEERMSVMFIVFEQKILEHFISIESCDKSRSY